MNLAIEYLLRNKKIHTMLSVPCSLFLTTDTDNKFVVTISNCWGNSDLLIVKHWRIWETKPEDKLPPFIEVKINKEEVFTSPMTIIENCKILDYQEQPFEAGGRQHTDYPLGYEESRQYQESLDNFYQSTLHKERKANWLWEEFDKIYIPIDLKLQYGTDPNGGQQLQREIIQFYSKPLWHKWLLWKKYLLEFPGTSAELVFRREYVHNEPAQRLSSSHWPTSFMISNASSTTSGFYSFSDR
jgi:hypothetical protein